jgi:predicted nucleotidyltransferase
MTRRETPLDAAELLRVLAEHGVDYVIIGGMAVQAHGHTRTTQDLDIVPAPDPVNLGRLEEALKRLVRSTPALGGTAPISLETRAGGLDIHPAPPGAAPYPELRARALELEVGGVRLRVAGRDDLIAMKLASGRPIDRFDVIALTAGESD